MQTNAPQYAILGVASQQMSKDLCQVLLSRSKLSYIVGDYIPVEDGYSRTLPPPHPASYGHLNHALLTQLH